MKRRYYLGAVVLAVIQLFSSAPVYASSNVEVNEEMVMEQGTKSREVAVSNINPSKSVYIDTYVYKEPTTKAKILKNGDVENNIYIVKRIFPTETSEDYPYFDDTLSIFGTVTITTSEYSDSYSSYKKIKQVSGSWQTKDNQVVVTQQKVGAGQIGIQPTGDHFSDSKEKTYGNASSWTFSDPIASWPYIEVTDVAVYVVTLEVTVKDLFSGDTWTTGMNETL